MPVRTGRRFHAAAASLALAVSILLHFSLFTRIDSLPALILPASPEAPRFRPIEMVEVRTRPPPPPDQLETVTASEAADALPSPSPETIRASAPAIVPMPTLPLPPPPPEAVSVAASPGAEAPVPPVRQDILTIEDPVIGEADAALPRRWSEADIPRIAQAPDIQLPVEATATGPVPEIPEPMRADAWLEATDAGTPDWSALIERRSLPAPAMAGLVPILPGGTGDGGTGGGAAITDPLQPIDDLLRITVHGYAPAAEPYLYATLQIEAVPGGALTVQPRDILFIQDSSESMTPVKLDECRRGLKRWLDFLNPGDRFEVMGFREGTYACFNGWEPFTPETKSKAVAFINGLRAVGDTDVYRSLESAFTRSIDTDRATLLVLITDGRPTVGVIGSSEIIEGITRFNQGRVSMFSVGGGKKVNSFFLDLLSYRNRGEAVIARGEEEIPAAMEAWARQLQRPVLTDLTYTFSGVDASEIYPKQLTHLFLDRPLRIHGRFPKDTQQIVFQVVGRAGNRRHDMVFVIGRDQIATGDAALREQWAWQKAYHLIGDYLGDSSEERLEKIRDFADSFGLLVPYGFSRAMPRSGAR